MLIDQGMIGFLESEEQEYKFLTLESSENDLKNDKTFLYLDAKTGKTRNMSHPRY